MKKTYLLNGIAPSIALAILVGCQTTSTPAPEDRFAKADANHDGKISLDESSDYFVGRLFEGRDANHDNKLTWEEWHVPGANDSKARFDKADTDKDGSLSLDEARAYGRKRGLFKQQFAEADTNHDGFVTREEAQAYAASKEGPPR